MRQRGSNTPARTNGGVGCACHCASRGCGHHAGQDGQQPDSGDALKAEAAGKGGGVL